MDVYIGNIKHGFGLETEDKYISLNIFFAGCSRDPKCEGCHNPGLWEKENGVCMKVSQIREIVEMDDIIKALVFLGGEPLDQEEALLEISQHAKEKGIKRYLYTGLEYEDISTEIREVMDVIIAGPYQPALSNSEGVIPASSNQTVIRN